MGVSDHGTTHMRVGRIGPVARDELVFKAHRHLNHSTSGVKKQKKGWVGPVAREKVEGPARQLDEDERGAVCHVSGLDVCLLHAIHLRGRTSQRDIMATTRPHDLTSWARCGRQMGEGEGVY